MRPAAGEAWIGSGILVAKGWLSLCSWEVNELITRNPWYSHEDLSNDWSQCLKPQYLQRLGNQPTSVKERILKNIHLRLIENVALLCLSLND